MLERALPLAALLLLPAAARLARPPAATPAPAVDRPLVALLPAGTLAVVEAPGLAELAARGLSDPLVAAVLAGGVDDLLRAGAGADAAGLLARADEAAGLPVLETAAALARDGAVLGIGVARGGPAWTFAMRGDDPELLQATLLAAFERLEERFGVRPGAVDAGRHTVHGAQAWKLGDDVALAARGGLFVACSSEGLLEQALERAAAPPAAGDGELALRPELARALAPAGPHTVLCVTIDLDRLDALAQLGGGKRLDKLRALPGTPAVQLLLGAGVAELGSAETGRLALELEGTRLRLRVTGAGTRPTEVLRARGDRPAPPAPAPNARDVARGLVYRDLAAAFTERVDLFPPAAMPPFAKAESDLALFFGGEDLARDVLSGVSPWARLVVREVAFAPDRTPENPLPAAALVLALDEPDVLGPKLVSAFQTAIGLVNIQRAQEREPGFLLALEQVGAATLTSAGLPTPGPMDGVDAIYNLEPACARLGGTFVLATHAALARELADELAGASAAPPGAVREWLAIDGDGVARALAGNRETLIARNALEKGHGFDAARAEIAALERLAGLLERASVAVEPAEVPGAPGARAVELVVELALHGRDEERTR